MALDGVESCWLVLLWSFVLASVVEGRVDKVWPKVAVVALGDASLGR